MTAAKKVATDFEEIIQTGKLQIVPVGVNLDLHC
jgi:hypothetical protein